MTNSTINQRFPGNRDLRSFRIRRRLSRPSRHEISFCEELPSVFPGRGIKPIHRETDMTIVGKMDIVDARKAVPRLGNMLFKDLAAEVLEPKPFTADTSLLLKAHHIGFIGVRDTVRAAIYLNDENEVLDSEYDKYTGRLTNMGVTRQWRGMLPHVSLALVPKSNASGEILDWLQERAPDELMLLPVDTDPRVPKN